MGRRPRLSKYDCLDIDQNKLIKSEEDKIYYLRLVEMIKTHKYGLCASIASKANTDLRNWIYSKTLRLVDTDKFQYKISTRVFWVRYGLADFPKCRICGNTIGVNCDIKLVRGYPDHCSFKCAQHDSIVMQRKIDTNVKQHGVNWWTNPNLMTQTLIERYGVDNYTKTSAYKDKQKEGFRKHYGVDHNMKCEKGRHEWSESYKVRTGYDHNWKNPESREICKQSCIAKYGVDHNMKCEAGREKWRQSIRDKYGVEYDHNWKVPEVREHYHDTCERRYGVRHPQQCPEIRKLSQYRYIYDGIHFDSKPEIAFYVWLKDHGVDFKYQPDECFNYEFDGMNRRYFPDFKVGDRFYEIKGDHMISESGTWICPWNHSHDAQYDAKRKCAEANGVVVLTSNEYAKYLKYIDEKYGRGWLDQFKNIPSEK